MNRVSCQNQGMPRCAARGANQENRSGNMRASMPCQMRTNTASQSQDCGCGQMGTPENDWRRKVPTESREQLLNYINEVSFGAYDALLYLDTHPDCPEALHYFGENNEKRQFALKEYTRLYGPLNLDRVRITCDTLSWEWVNQPWPWEGGAC